MVVTIQDKKMSYILQIISDLNQIQDLDLLLERILHRARLFFNADAGSIYLRQGNELKFSYTQNETLQKRLEKGKKLIYRTFSIPIDKRSSIAGYVAQRCLQGDRSVTLNIPDVYKLSDSLPYSFNPEFDRKADYRTTSMLTVPMTNQKNELIGVLQLINARDERGNIIPFSYSDEPYILHFAESSCIGPGKGADDKKYNTQDDTHGRIERL